MIAGYSTIVIRINCKCTDAAADREGYRKYSFHKSSVSVEEIDHDLIFGHSMKALRQLICH